VRDFLSHRVNAWQIVNLRLAVPQLLSIRISHTTLSTVFSRLQNHQPHKSQEREIDGCLRRSPVIRLRNLRRYTYTLDVDPDNSFPTSCMLMKLSNLSHRLNISIEQSRADPQLRIVILYLWHGPGHPWLKGCIVAHDNIRSQLLHL
jgi:hypothetical protein